MDDEIAAFLERFDAVYGEYEQGYADADVTLRQIKNHVESLREAEE